jgi:hypothetical protein
VVRVTWILSGAQLRVKRTGVERERDGLGIGSDHVGRLLLACVDGLVTT